MSFTTLKVTADVSVCPLTKSSEWIKEKVEPFIVAARVDAIFFPPSSYKECECVGEQHKSRPHLHLLGTRDWYLNNDKQPTPHSFTAAIERHLFSDVGSACTVFGSLYADEAGGTADRRKQSETSRCDLVHLNALSSVNLFSLIPASSPTTNCPKDPFKFL